MISVSMPRNSQCARAVSGMEKNAVVSDSVVVAIWKAPNVLRSLTDKYPVFVMDSKNVLTKDYNITTY